MATGSEDWGAVLTALARGDRVAHVKVTGVIMGLLAQQRIFDLRDRWDDICQEVLLKLIKSVRNGSIRDATAFVSFCATVTRRESYRWLKLQRQAKEALTNADAEAEVADDQRSRDPELLVQIAQALEALPERQRQVMDAIYLRGFTYEEASARLGIPLGTLKRAQTQALNELRERMGTSADPAHPISRPRLTSRTGSA